MLFRCFFVFVILCLAACAEQKRQFNSDWATLHGDMQRTRQVPDAPRPPLQEGWVFEGKGRILYPPSVANGTVYLSARDGTLTALKLEDGAQIWQENIEQGGLFSAPTLHQNVLFAGKWVPYYYVYAYEAATGKMLWSVRSGELESRPPWVLADETQVYTHGDPALDAPREQGVVAQAWQRDTQDLIWKQPLDGLPNVAPALSENLILYATTEKKLYALERKTGQIQWTQDLSGPPASAPLIHQGLAIVASNNGFLYAVELKTGKLAWRYQFPQRELTGDLALSQNLLLIPSKNYLLSFDIKALEARWNYRAPRDITAALVSQNHVYFGCENKLFYVIDREKGFLRASYRTGGAIYAAPVAAGGKILVGSEDGKLYSYTERPVEKKAPESHPFNRRL